MKAEVESLRVENEELKIKREWNQKETHEFVAYFKTEMEKKDTEVDDLTEEQEKIQRESQDLIESLKRSYEQQLSKISEEKEQLVFDLTNRLRVIEEEMKSLTEMKLNKEQLEAVLSINNAEKKRLAENHDETLTRLERRKMEEKVRIQIEMESKLHDVRLKAREEAQKNLQQVIYNTFKHKYTPL